MNFVNLFIEEFQVSPLDSISMPSLASKISWQFYDPKCYAIFSFSKEFGFLNDQIRSFGLNGGLVSKFFFVGDLFMTTFLHRHFTKTLGM